MISRQLSLQGGITVPAVNITDSDEIPEALIQLKIPHPKSVIVLVGGAGGMGFWDKFPMRKAVGIVAKLAQETQSIVVDGGTQAGIMTEIGRQRKRNKFTFPLIGVVVSQVAHREEPQSILDPNHTHFILVPGDDWGDESAWIAKIASVMTGNKKSITVLINGGRISRMDVQHSVSAARTTFVMRGTGRMADEIMLEDKVIAVDVSRKPGKIREILKSELL